MSLCFGAGVPVAFLLMAGAEILKKMSIYGFYDPVKPVHGSAVLGVNLVYIGITVVLFNAVVLFF